MDQITLPAGEAIATAIAETDKPEDISYMSTFRRRAAELGDGWNLLADVFNLSFRSGNVSEPFGPMVQIDGKRSLVPADLTDKELDALWATLDAIDDPEYRARIADILWLRRRDVNAARSAVKDYLHSGSRLEDPAQWSTSMKRYERAARLARQIEAKGDLPKKVLGHLQARVFHYNGKDPLYFTCQALTLLEEFGFGDFAELAEIANRVASEARQGSNFDRARSYFDIGARLLKRAHQPEAAESARVAHAETFVEEAEVREKANAHIAAHVFWEQALKAFRERPSLRARIPEIHKRLAEAGKKALGEMKTHGVELDVGEMAAKAEEHMAGRSREDALFAFVLLVGPLDPKKLREETLASMSDSPLRTTIAATIYDAAGRKIGIRPAVTADLKEREAAIEGFMEEQGRFHRQVTVRGALAPAMRQLLGEHEIDDQMLDELVGDSLLIPEGRRPLFIQSIAAGFRWDFSTALHVLVPQVEHGLRQVLESYGVVPRNVDPSGVEEVWSYERILSHPKIKEALGESMAYELESLLVGRLGSNFRNLIAHGLLSPDALGGDMALYLWWILLRLTSIPTQKLKEYTERNRRQEVSPAEAQPT
jgi:hypothetical protein